jgi:hypothetical protein
MLRLPHAMDHRYVAAASRRAGPARPSRRDIVEGAVSDWLAHPLVLLVAGAVLSSLVIPSLTRRWQNHQKELEVKTGLVAEITNAVTSLVMAVQFAELGSRTQSQEDLDEAYRAWETEAAVIASKLRAYFPKAQLAREWSELARLTTNFYALAGMSDRKQQFLQDLLGEVRSRGPALDREAAEELARFRGLGVSGGRVEWAELKAHVLARKDAIVRGVLDARSAI